MAPAIPVFECFIRVTTGDSQRAPLASGLFLASRLILHPRHVVHPVSDSFVVPFIAVVP